MARMTKQETTKPAYAYPAKSRCPRCGSLETMRVGEHPGIQYRQCRHGGKRLVACE